MEKQRLEKKPCGVGLELEILVGTHGFESVQVD